MSNYLDFISDDVKVGLLKMGRVDMIRRTLSFKAGVKFTEFSYLPYVKSIIVIKGDMRFE